MAQHESGRALAPAVIHLAAIFMQKVLPWLLAIALILAVRDAAVSMSGQSSLAGAWLDLTSRLKVTRSFAFIFGGLGIVYGLKQRNLRRASEEKLTARIAAIERGQGTA